MNELTLFDSVPQKYAPRRMMTLVEAYTLGVVFGYLGTPPERDVDVSDFFAGAGGSSTGATQAGIQVRVAANHWKTAVEIHNANHPDTDHSLVDLHQERASFFPRTTIGWFSPECTKWSQANGKKLPAIEEGLFEDPLSDDVKLRSRLLMFDVLRFIEYHRYRLVIVENVVDVATQAKYRTAWTVWRQELRALGYRFRVVSLNSMHAQAYGLPAPQSRDRIYVVAWPEGESAPDVDRILRPRAYCPRCDTLVESVQAFKPGREVGRYRQAYLYRCSHCNTAVEPFWLAAATAIDWSLPGQRIGDRLKPKTRARIAAGIARYWGPLSLEAAGNTYDAADPAHPHHGDPDAYYRAWPLDEPLRALHTTNSKALAVPVEGRDGKDAAPADWPLRTQTTRAETALAHLPLPGEDGSGPAGGPDWRAMEELGMDTRHIPFIAEMYGTSTARPLSDPAGTFTAGGNHHGLVMHYERDRLVPSDAELDVLATTAAGGIHDALITRHNNNRGDQSNLTTPVGEYMRTLTTTAQQSIIRRPVNVTAGDLRAAEALVPEVLFRMFCPHEVAAGMAFPADYVWQPVDRLKPVSNRDLVKAAGNAVTPPTARDLLAMAVDSLSLAA